MAYTTNADFYGIWINGYVPGGVNYQDIWDSFAKVPRIANLSAGGTTMVIRYMGDAIPVFTNPNTGEYLLVIPSGTTVRGFYWIGDLTHLSGGAATLTVRDTDGEEVYYDPGVFSEDTGDKFGISDGIRVRQTSPAAGDVETLFPNLALFGAPGWRIVANLW